MEKRVQKQTISTLSVQVSKQNIARNKHKTKSFRPHTRLNTWKNPYGFSAGAAGARGGKERKREKLRVFISAP